MPNSFTIKTIEIIITLDKGLFPHGGNTKIIEGLACEVNVHKPGLPEKNSASIKVWGLSFESMSMLTTLAFKPLEYQHNTISINAGTRGDALSLVFHGEITSAYADFNQIPDPCMNFEAHTGSYPHQLPLPVMTVNGEMQASRLFELFARQAGYTFTNQGVTSSVRNAWFPGSAIHKMMKLAHDIKCQLIIDDGEVTILPEGVACSGSPVLLSSSTGLIGYPTFTQDGISCRCIYNPNLIHNGLIQIDSNSPGFSNKTAGLWRITNLSHSLSAYCPNGGNWESNIEAAYYE